MATWQPASALTAGNCLVPKPAEQIAAALLVLVDLITDLLPAGVLTIVNGFGAGVWSRDANRCDRFGRAIEAGQVWKNNDHTYPAHAAFGAEKQSGIGRENHKAMRYHDRLGFF